jgi:hypothetical protein
MRQLLSFAGIPEGTVEFCGAAFAWGSRAWAGQRDVVPGELNYGDHKPSKDETKDSKTAVPKPATPSKEADIETGVVNTSRVNNGSSSNSKDADYTAPVTLYNPVFRIAPGQFVGVAGEVWLLIRCSCILHVPS